MKTRERQIPSRSSVCYATFISRSSFLPSGHCLLARGCVCDRVWQTPVLPPEPTYHPPFSFWYRLADMAPLFLDYWFCLRAPHYRRHRGSYVRLPTPVTPVLIFERAPILRFGHIASPPVRYAVQQAPLTGPLISLRATRGSLAAARRATSCVRLRGTGFRCSGDAILPIKFVGCPPRHIAAAAANMDRWTGHLPLAPATSPPPPST